MPVPGFQSMMLPVLKCIADGKEHARKDIRQQVANMLHLTEDELAEKLPSGNSPLLITGSVGR
jgi:restriction system protein